MRHLCATLFTVRTYIVPTQILFMNGENKMDYKEENNYYIDNTHLDFSHMNPEFQNTPAKDPGIGLAITSMVIGILSLTLCCVCGSLFGIIGLIFGIIALKKKQRGTGMAIAGIATSVLGFLVGLVIILYIVFVASLTGSILENYDEIMSNPDFYQYMESEDFDMEDFELYYFDEFDDL